jgi:hypothetical protein
VGIKEQEQEDPVIVNSIDELITITLTINVVSINAAES